MEKKKTSQVKPKASPVGRPVDYEERFNIMAYVACYEGGFTDLKLSKLFNVSKSTINRWKRKYPKFWDSIKKGKDEFNVVVAEDCLLKRVRGFSYNEVTSETVVIKEDGKAVRDEDGNVKTEFRVTKKVRKLVPSDTTANIFFLKNRDPDRWRDKKDVEHSGDVTFIRPPLVKKPEESGT